MLNNVVLIGRLTKDPELRYTGSGTAVTKFTLAVDRPFVKEGGQREADFIPVIVWRKAAEACANHLVKGSLVAVEGRIQTRNYENEAGQRVYVTEVIADNVRFLSQPKNNGGTQGSQSTSGDPFVGDGQPIDISDDDLPF